MVMDVVDRRTQLIVGESRWAGKRISDFGVQGSSGSLSSSSEAGFSDSGRAKLSAYSSPQSHWRLYLDVARGFGFAIDAL